MKGQKALFSHKRDDWETPQDLFDELDKEFHFYLDIGATEENAKAGFYISNLQENELVMINIKESKFKNMKNTKSEKQFCWCNPPYSQQRKFIEYCINVRRKTVFLLPARTDTKLFHELIYNNPDMKIRFLKGRLKFKGGVHSAPFPSMIVIYNPKE